MSPNTVTDSDRRNFGHAPLLSAHHLTKHYSRRQSWLGRRSRIKALNDVSLSLEAGSTLAVIGESGAGKSTLGRCLALLDNLDSGEVLFEGQNLRTLHGRDILDLRRRLQFIFQDSVTAMNPHFSAAEVIEEPLLIQSGTRQRRKQTLELMEEVGLSPKLASRSPLELSGGERRRLALARALSVKPSLLILDEALAGLDLPLQAHLANLLMELQRSYNLAYVYISHDLRLSSYLADRIAIMKDGKILECGPVRQIFFQPKHSYTSRLVSLIPLLFPGEFDPRGSCP